jgi:DAK2 domain fusion protein YloV
MGTPPNDLTPTTRTERVAEAASAGAALDGTLLRRLFTDACGLLERHVQALNAINVFPVPDGDTGTNMHLTLQAGVKELSATAGGGLSVSARALAHGSLMGARGNSGVILSQILRGSAAALDGRPAADGPVLAAALSAAAQAAQEALSEPVEGTILTVVREAALAVAENPPPTIEETLSRAVTAARDAVARTPDLLPVLKEAGVVDAGGLGLSIILQGLLRSLRTEALDVNLAPDSAVEAGWRSEAASLHRAEHGESGYCTEFMISGQSLQASAVRAHLISLGTSLLVVGGDDLLRVHLHTTRPDDAIAYGRTLGKLSQVKVDNLEAQIQRFVSERPPPPVTTSIGVVVVAAGEGIEAAFRSVGVPNLVRGGQTMNPSAAEILEAIEACPAEHVVVLPNNKNIIAAARQAAEKASKRVAVVPSRSIPQGVAAVLALNPDLPFEATTEAMESALTSVRSAEVTRAVRATVVDGRHIEMGQAIGIIDGALRVVAEDIEAAAEACVDEMLSSETSLLTLYAGEDVRDKEAEALAVAMRARYPDLEVELVRGGQPHYPYILSLE